MSVGRANILAPSVMLAVFITSIVVSLASSVGEARPAYTVEWTLVAVALVTIAIPALLAAAIGFALGKEYDRG